MRIEDYVWFENADEKQKLAEIIENNDKPIAIQNIANEFKLDRVDAAKAYNAFASRMKKGGDSNE